MHETVRLTKDQRRGWLTYIAALKRELPAKVEIRTGRTNSGNAAQAIHYDNGTHKITIGSHLNYQERIDALEHEYSHVLDIDENGQRKKEHRQSWGRHLARVRNVLDATSERLENG